MLNLNALRHIQFPIIMRMLDPQKDDYILDAGCGNGIFAYNIGKKCKCLGLDIQKRTSWKIIQSKNPERVTFKKGDILKMPFERSQFNKILLSSILQMVKSDNKALLECRRVLKKRGVLVLSIPTSYVFIKKLNNLKRELRRKFKADGKCYYSWNEIKKLLTSNRFRIISTEYSPKRIGSIFYETILFITFKLNLPLFHWSYFFLLYPLMFLDHFSPHKSVGCEILIKAKKI